MASWTLLDAFSTTSVQLATEPAPVSAADGMKLDGVRAITVWLDAGPGQTITSDAGQADVYVFDNGRWGFSGISMAVPPHSAGLQRVSLGTVPIDNQRGRLAPVCNAVTVSGATATLDILVTIDRLGGSRAA